MLRDARAHAESRGGYWQDNRVPGRAGRGVLFNADATCGLRQIGCVLVVCRAAQRSRLNFPKQALAHAWARHGYKNASLNDGTHLAFREIPKQWGLTVQ